MSSVSLHAPCAGWLVALDTVPDAVFAERMMGDGVAIEPLDQLVCAPADAEVVALPASGHAVTLRLANGAELLIHVGLETVALGGRGFRALVSAGERVTLGQPLIEVDLDTVAQAAKDMVTPLVLPGEGVTLELLALDRLVGPGDPIGRVTAGTVAAGSGLDGAVLTRSVRVAAPHGLHARPAARIVAMAKRYDADLTVAYDGKEASARSAVALLTLGAAHDAMIELRAAGEDAAAALDALAAFAAERFGDAEGTAASPPPPGRAGAVCAVPGLAIGRVRQVRAAEIEVAEEGRGVEAEARALDEAVRRAVTSLPPGDLAEAHRAMLEDPALRAAADRTIATGRSAGFAWRNAAREAAAAMVATGDARLAERAADFADIERQVLVALSGSAPPAPLHLPADTILIAQDLLPSQFQALDRTALAGICTAAGGPTAHVAILAAAAGVPMVVAAGDDVLAIPDDTPAILDADAARLLADPDEAMLAEARARSAERSERTAAEREAAQAPCRTADGVRIEVFANLGSMADAEAAVAAGAEGCGLLRTEFLFMDRAEPPSEEEQRALYAGIAAALGDRPLIVRTLDIGGDKPVAYLPAPAEANPALGQRGIRLSLARPDLLATQLRAILAAVAGGRCRLLLPMVIEPGEVAAIRAAVDDAASAVGRRERVEIGVMVETPAAAILADQIAAEADFLSVGTNDLTQYALAADRGNPLVAAMVDALHPAVLRLIAQAAAGAMAHGRWIGVCGALASDPRAAALLVGLGVTELSAAPAMVPAIKAAVRATTLPAAQALAARALAAPSAAAVRALIEAAA